jgi:hypothetical protein
MSTRPNRLNVIRLAAAAAADPRSARRYLLGEAMRSDLLRGRLDAAARELGLAPDPSGAAPASAPPPRP